MACHEREGLGARGRLRQLEAKESRGRPRQWRHEGRLSQWGDDQSRGHAQPVGAERKGVGPASQPVRGMRGGRASWVLEQSRGEAQPVGGPSNSVGSRASWGWSKMWGGRATWSPSRMGGGPGTWSLSKMGEALRRELRASGGGTGPLGGRPKKGLTARAQEGIP